MITSNYYHYHLEVSHHNCWCCLKFTLWKKFLRLPWSSVSPWTLCDLALCLGVPMRWSLLLTIQPPATLTSQPNYTCNYMPISRDTLSKTSVFLEIFHKVRSEEERGELLPRYCLVKTMSKLSKAKYVSDSLHYIE